MNKHKMSPITPFGLSLLIKMANKEISIWGKFINDCEKQIKKIESQQNKTIIIKCTKQT